jgi:hypothetical protein
MPGSLVKAKSGSDATTPCIPVSWGDLIDKITILQIKEKRLKRRTAVTNVRKELRLLARVAAPVLEKRPQARELMAQLKAVNQALWKTEDQIRAKEARGQFDSEFIALARSVYLSNDTRAALKRKINARLASPLLEEKQYTPYRRTVKAYP